jgi:hypothetical protein
MAYQGDLGVKVSSSVRPMGAPSRSQDVSPPIACNTLDLGAATRWVVARRMFWRGRSSIGMTVVLAIMKGKFGSLAPPMVPRTSIAYRMQHPRSLGLQYAGPRLGGCFGVVDLRLG